MAKEDFAGGTLTDPTMAGVGSTPSYGGVPRVPSSFEAGTAALSGLLGQVTKAMPLIDDAIMKADVKNFIERRQKIFDAREQKSITPTQANTRLRQFEIELEQAPEAVQNSVMRQLGIQTLGTARRREAVSQENQLYWQEGRDHYENSNLPMPDDITLMEVGKEIAIGKQRRAQELSVLQAKLAREEVDDKIAIEEYGSLYTKNLAERHSTLMSGYTAVMQQADPRTSAGQRIFGDLAVSIDNLINVEKQAIRMEMNNSGQYDDNVISKVQERSLKGLVEINTLLKSEIKEGQDAVKALFEYKKNRVKSNLIEKGVMGYVAAEGREALGTLTKAMNPNLAQLNRLFEEAVSDSGSMAMSSTRNDPKEVFSGVMESHRESTPELTFKDNGSRFAYIQGVNVKAGEYLKTGAPQTQEKATEYGATISKMLTPLTDIEKFENMSAHMKILQNPEHTKALSRLPSDQRVALESKISRTAVDVSRKTLRTVGTVPGIIVYNAETGRFAVDPRVMDDARRGRRQGDTFIDRLARGEGPDDASVIGGFVSQFVTGENVPELTDELNRVSKAVSTLNQMMSIYDYHTGTDPRLSRATVQEKGFIMAQILSQTSPSLRVEGEFPLTNVGTGQTVTNADGTAVSLEDAGAALLQQTQQAVRERISGTPDKAEATPEGPEPGNTAPIIPVEEAGPLQPVGIPQSGIIEPDEEVNLDEVDDRQLPPEVQQFKQEFIQNPERVKSLLDKVNKMLNPEESFRAEVKKSFGNMSPDWGTMLFDWVSNKVKGPEEMLKEFENSDKVGFDETVGKWFPYPSLEGGTDTVAYGHKLTKAEADSGILEINGQKVNWKQGLTEEQAAALLEQDTAKFRDVAEASLTKADLLNDDTSKALTSLIYNIGEGAWKRSKAKVALEKGDLGKFYDEAFGEKGWIRIKDVESRGLKRRRAAEERLFKKGLDK